jgi:hypothetical protein
MISGVPVSQVIVPCGGCHTPFTQLTMRVEAPMNPGSHTPTQEPPLLVEAPEQLLRQDISSSVVSYWLVGWQPQQQACLACEQTNLALSRAQRSYFVLANDTVS